MPTPIPTPRINNNDDLVRLSKVLVAIGSQVKSGDPIVDVETDKATFTVESDRDGFLLAVNGTVGDMIEVGSVLAWIGLRPPGPHVSAGAAPHNRWMAETALDRAAVLDDIRGLTTASSPQLERVERTLADGYACALWIEAQRLRLQRELEGRAVGLSSGEARRVDEVAGLAQGIAQADEELTELRAALVELARMARRLRTS